jgi:hypothetical protein
MFKKGKITAILVIALILSVTTYAFAAANTVPATNAGDGSAAVSGYSITGVSYTLFSTDNSSIDKVNFSISPVTATNVKIQLVTNGSWYPCNNTAGSVICSVGGVVTVLAANNLRIVAVQ